jgi:hypothetical protein
VESKVRILQNGQVADSLLQQTVCGWSMKCKPGLGPNSPEIYKLLTITETCFLFFFSFFGGNKKGLKIDTRSTVSGFALN